MKAYIVTFYAKGSRLGLDCHPAFFGTLKSARAAGRQEIRRVRGVPADQQDHTLDWAVRFTTRAVYLSKGCWERSDLE